MRYFSTNDIAKSLYDGGWRCEDWRELIDEYDFSLTEIYEICGELELLEMFENERQNQKFKQ